MITYPKFYTADQISQDFFDNYYNRNQIIMQSTKLKLTFLLKKKNYVRKYSEEEEQEIIKLMKKNGFKWSPKNICWQRLLNSNAIFSVKNYIEPELNRLNNN